MSQVYLTNDNDIVDQIAKTYLGHEDQVVRIYEANPGLAAIGPALPAGLKITIPDPEVTTKTSKGIRLWGDDET